MKCLIVCKSCQFDMSFSLRPLAPAVLSILQDHTFNFANCRLKIIYLKERDDGEVTGVESKKMICESRIMTTAFDEGRVQGWDGGMG